VKSHIKDNNQAATFQRQAMTFHVLAFLT